MTMSLLYNPLVWLAAIAFLALTLALLPRDRYEFYQRDDARRRGIELPRHEYRAMGVRDTLWVLLFGAIPAAIMVGVAFDAPQMLLLSGGLFGVFVLASAEAYRRIAREANAAGFPFRATPCGCVGATAVLGLIVLLITALAAALGATV